jgi:hypothetical protein
MFTDPSLTLAGQLFWIVDVFCKTMAPEACKRRIGSLSVAVWSRVKRFERRFSVLYARWKAGKLPRPRPPASTPVSTPGTSLPARPERELAAIDAARLRPASVLPRTFAWLHKLLPMSAPPLTGGLESLLWNFPEMQEFVAAAPQVGRILRPFCRMVGLRPPEWLALPKPTRRRVRKKNDPLPPHPAAARFPDTPAARAAARALAREQAGLPVDVSGLSAVAYGYYVHPPRDDNCPPPEIGYGGRVRWLPRRYQSDSKNRD